MCKLPRGDIMPEPEPVPRARGTARGARGARWQRETGRTSCASRTWKNSLSGRLEKSSMEGRTIYYAQILRPSLCASLSGDLSPSSTLPCDCSCWCSPPTQQPALKRSSSTRTRTVWRKVSCDLAGGSGRGSALLHRLEAGGARGTRSSLG